MNVHATIAFVICCIFVVDGGQMATFFWDSRNKIFQNKICGGENAHILVNYGSSITFTCPHKALTSSVLEQNTNQLQMYENLYLVTYGEYKNCTVGPLSHKTRFVMNCDSPEESTSIKYVNFFIFDVKSSLRYQFQINKTYYFIATSNGKKDSLGSLKDGRCKTDNMKLAMTIQESDGALNDHLCKIPLPDEPIATEKPKNNSTLPIKASSQPNVVDENDDVVTSKIYKPKENGNSAFNTISAVCLVVGLLAGILFSACLVTLKMKFLSKDSTKASSSPSPPSCNGSVFNIDQSVNQPQKEIINRQYFDNSNPNYRHSTEFKRLISESSASSSERHSVTPIGEYC